MTVTDHSAGVHFDHLLPEDLEAQILNTFPGVVISHTPHTTRVSLVVSANTALELLQETDRAMRALCAMVGNDGDSVDLNELVD